jgi:hypothetical protein
MLFSQSSSVFGGDILWYCGTVPRSSLFHTIDVVVVLATSELDAANSVSPDLGSRSKIVTTTVTYQASSS